MARARAERLILFGPWAVGLGCGSWVCGLVGLWVSTLYAARQSGAGDKISGMAESETPPDRAEAPKPLPPQPSRGEQFYRHGLRRVTGRDPGEAHRAASPLELFYDLTFATAIAVASSQLAAGVVGGYGFRATMAFGLTFVAIVWAWVGHTWYSASFSVDDWLERVLVLVQMVGVLIVAIGIPVAFESIEHTDRLDNRIMIAGYVVLRLALVALWVRLWFGDPALKGIATVNIFAVAAAQTGWVWYGFAQLDMTLGTAVVAMAPLWILDLGAPVWAQRKALRIVEGGAPWNPAHISERYSLFALLCIGETLVGTLSSASEIQAVEGWNAEAIAALGIGVLTSFGLWWAYYLIPSEPVLEVHRERVVGWSFLHVPLLASIAATGAGLHMLGAALTEPDVVPATTGTLALAVPVSLFTGCIIATRLHLTRGRFSVVSGLGLALPLVGVGVSYAGAPLWWSLALVLASPTAIIVFYEAGGWRGLTRQLDVALASAEAPANPPEVK